MRSSSNRIKALHAAIVLASGLLASAGALGLVLGDISLQSALNEPLAATIELDSLEGADASMINVTVGDQAAYDRVNMERPPILDDIEFTVEVDNDDAGRIQLRTTQSLSEPFLNLIISVNEPGGTTIREYTLLVDLPANSAVTQAASATQGEPAQPAPAVSAATAAALAAGPDTYTVTSGDTLYEIAQNLRPDTNVGVEQMMLAIQRANPDAFIEGNINRLINGRVLRIPSQQDIGAVDQRAAVAQVTQQNANLGGQPLAAGGNTAASNAADTRDQLRVLSGDDAPSAGGGSSDLAATIAALENELMLSEESLDRARIENLELTNRLSSLQEQIDLLENIIAIEDERIAGLQAELSQQADATANALASANTAANELAEINDTPPSGLTGLLRNTVVLLGIGAALVLLALAVLFQRRRQAQAQADVEANSFNPALVDADEVVVAEEKPGLLAGLLARFRRKDVVEDDYSDDEADAIIAAESEPAAGLAPQPVAAAKKDSTDNLLDEMGISEDLMSLDDVLDGVDSDHAEEAADVFEPVEEEAVEASAPVAVAEAEPEAEPAAMEFTTTDAVAPVDVPTEVVQEDPADTFEFTLKDLPDETAAPAAAAVEKIESFDFKLSTPAPAPQPEPAAATKPETLEFIAFPGAAKTPSAAAPEEDISLELGDLSFDDTMLGDESETESETESEYKPRTGNECDTKLDLATAYEAMGDVVEAIEILDEVINEGSPEQVETAQRLKETWQASL